MLTAPWCIAELCSVGGDDGVSQKSLLSVFENPVISNTFEFWCHLRSDFFSRGSKPLSKQGWGSRNQKAREQNAKPLCRITKASFDLLIPLAILSSWRLLLFF